MYGCPDERRARPWLLVHLARPVHPAHGTDIIWSACHTFKVKWDVEMADEFKPEFDALGQDVRREVLALARVLQEFGPRLGRPRVDTLNGSAPCQYEGIAIQRGRRGMASGLRL
jgi:hypothetical protein